ncbi:MAG: hypothetical protein WCB79_02695 [Halobacteriota archaeon]
MADKMRKGKERNAPANKSPSQRRAINVTVVGDAIGLSDPKSELQQ